ncbi:MAG TPA: c-type cytochrome [Burkholderiaceae bacterium]
MRHLFSIASLAGAVLVAGCADPSRSRALDDPKVPGRALAEQVCSNCHGQRGVASSENFPHLAAQQADYIDGQLRSLRDKHRRDPAGFVYMWGIASGLTDAQIGQLAAYYAAQPAPAPDPAALAEPNAGKRLFTEGQAERGVPACAGCHGDRGQGNGAIPRLAHQHRAYLLRQLAVLRQSPDNRPMGTLMNSVAHQLNDDDMRELADYISTM